MNPNTQPFPNFFIIGVPKSGTTSLCIYLNQHPQVFISNPKEPNSFFYEYVDGDFTDRSDYIVNHDPISLQQYRKMFEIAGEARAIGESSFYLYSNYALDTLQRLAPNAKFVIVFRNPADRAYSNYIHLRMVGEETIKDFRAALAREDEAGHNLRLFRRYKELGLYARFLKRYLAVFRREQFHIQLYDHWKADNQKALREIFEFLDVDPNVSIDIKEQHMVGNEVRLTSLGNFLHNGPRFKQMLQRTFEHLLPKSVRFKIWSLINRLNSKPVPPLDPQIRAELIDFYRDDILELQELIDMDLSAWLEVSV